MDFIRAVSTISSSCKCKSLPTLSVYDPFTQPWKQVECFSQIHAEDPTVTRLTKCIWTVGRHNAFPRQSKGSWIKEARRGVVLFWSWTHAHFRLQKTRRQIWYLTSVVWLFQFSLLPKKNKKQKKQTEKPLLVSLWRAGFPSTCHMLTSRHLISGPQWGMFSLKIIASCTRGT